MYDINEWRPKVQKLFVEMYYYIEIIMSKEGGGHFRGRRLKDIKVLSTCNFNQTIRAVIIATE